jgi:hypothetical protein
MILPIQLPKDKSELQEVSTCGIKDTIKYLGVPYEQENYKK